MHTKNQKSVFPNKKSYREQLTIAVATGLALGLAPSSNPLHAAGKDLNAIITQVFLPILRNVVVLIFAIALIYFLWKVKDYVTGEKPGDALQGMGMGILAMFVMVTVWGLVRLLENTFGLEKGAP